ncbi:MAG: N-6 DNA methylase [Alphaproteobacteria bacterium]|nr:N-6 DNA methylase [Alphaproteobacteria bacterium]
MEVKIEGNKIYSFIREKWLVLTPEEKVRQTFVCHLINHYGYQLDQMDEELKVSNSHRGQGKARADIVIWKSKEDKQAKKNAFIVVECKAENVTIHKEDYYQGCNYARWAGAQFFITSNEKETSFFRVNNEIIPTDLDEIVDIPFAKDINDEKKIAETLNQLKKFERDEFAKLLQKCHNIIRNNDKLSPEAAFDEISKILFIKIRYERQNKLGIRFSKEEFEKKEREHDEYRKTYPELSNITYMQKLFDDTKRDFAKDKLFDANETIKIKEYSFKQIVKELEKYNLSNTSDDVKGIAFEKFLGTTFRGELGQFFTPRTLVDYIVGLLDPEEGESICDPCCGSGGFLIKAFEYVREKIEKDIQEQKEKIKQQFNDDSAVYNVLANKLNDELKVTETTSRMYNVSHNCIYGTDANPRMARVSKMNMIMHGDGHGGVHHHDGLLNVNGIFEERFDVILTNPPFGALVKDEVKITSEDIAEQKELRNYIIDRILSNLPDKKVKAIKDNFAEIENIKTSYPNEYAKCKEVIERSIIAPEMLNKAINKRFKIGSKLTEVLFIERCLNLLKKGGRMGIVLPDGVLNGANLQKCRDFVEGKAKILMITSLPQEVFIAAGATVKPSIMFFKKFTEEEDKQYKDITNKAQQEIEQKYSNQVAEAKMLPTKDKKAKLKEIEEQKQKEIKSLIKERFNYEIPIANVEKAGIDTLGHECENQLIEVLEEFKKYKKAHSMWKNPSKKTFKYDFDAQEVARKDAM